MTVKITAPVLSGYLLEEVLAYLIQGSGYRLLVDESQDPYELKQEKHGLTVRGRGANHQVDVLGQLDWIPAFTFPIRLFVEAKAHKNRTGLTVVRNAVGVLSDIRENKSPLKEEKSKGRPSLRQQYNYCYVLFSTSGFSEPATAYAMAHGVSLVDIEAPAFKPLVDAVRTCAKQITDAIGKYDELTHGSFLATVRDYLRTSLPTYPIGLPPLHQPELPPEFLDALSILVSKSQNFGELFIGMANGPFMLLLKADDRQSFLDYAFAIPRHTVRINWSRRHDDGLTWSITPADRPGAYRLTFRVPELLAEWIAGREGEYRENAIAAKERFFSNIYIYRKTEGSEDRLIRLEFDRRAVRRD